MSHVSTRTYYQSILTQPVRNLNEVDSFYPVGSLWCESSSPREVYEQSMGYPVRFEQMEVITYTKSKGWKPVSKKKIREAIT